MNKIRMEDNIEAVMILYVIGLAVFATATADASGEHARIIGSTGTFIDRNPHMISIRAVSRHICGGSLISSKHVATSADCLRIAPSTVQLEAQYGTSRRLNGGGSFRKITKVDVHPDFNVNDGDCDVAVATLEFRINFSVVTQPVYLAPLEDAPRPGEMLLTSGWGVKSENDGDNFPDILQTADLPCMDFDNCRYLYKWYNMSITENMLCAGTGTWGGGSAIYMGDAGNPLVKHGKLVGIASWGFPNAPSVFTNVLSPKVRGFIEGVLRQSPNL